MGSKDQKLLILVADEYEDLELHYPRIRCIEAGKKVVMAGAKKNIIYKGRHGYPCKADQSFEDVVVNDFTGLIISGGYAPDQLRQIPKVLEIVRQFDKQKKLIAFICHAGWIPISAKIIEGVKCTSYKAIKDDMIGAGGKWVDKPVVIDRHFISSRSPDDLPYFCPAILDYLNQK